MQNNFYFNLWMQNKFLSDDIKNEISKYSKEQICIYFNGELKFGTAGLRAKIGFGSSSLNIINIRRASIAFSKFLKTKYSKKELEKKGIIVGHDNRKLSKEFSIEAAKVFIYFNIKVTLFENNNPYPTPFVSYSIMKNNFLSGVMITASHNSKEYNGFKIFNELGYQYLPDDTNIMSKIYDISFNDATFFYINDNWIENKLLKYFNFNNKYISEVLKIQILPNEPKKIKIVFSNLNGTSKNILPKIFKIANYKYFYVVKEQYDFDENFTTCPTPNPELKENYKLATKYAKNNSADLIILNDPDADRIGISILHNKKYKILYANDLAPIILYYLITVKYKNNDKKLKKTMICSTIVSSDLCDNIANFHNITVKKVLTGFKWIGHKILENKHNKNLLLAYEEANGFIVSNDYYDKDGIKASILIAEITNYYKNKQKTLIDVLDIIYDKYGYFYCYTENVLITHKNKPEIIMNKIKQLNIKEIGHLKIVKIDDFSNQIYNFPKENLLKIYFDNNSWLAIRPSGTEPKIKFYFVFTSKISKNNAKIQLNEIKKILFSEILNKII